MTAVQQLSPVSLAGRRVAPAVFPNSLAKEFRASRPMIFIGLWIFFCMPVLISLPYVAFARTSERFPLATMFLALFGWLYAVIVGAEVVCRDFGRREGDFLLAQPVSPRAIMTAKLLAGLFTLAVVAVAGLACDLVFVGTKEGLPSSLEMLAPALLFACVFAVCYLLAFGLAAVVRQMLTSVLLTLLILLICVAAPLISHRLSWLFLPRLLGDASDWLGRVFLIVIGGLSIVAGFWGVNRERRLRIGPKTLGWAIALTVTGLFVAAMGEVGNSLPLQSQTWVYQTGADGSAPGNPEAVLASGDGWYYLVNSRMPYVRFRLAADGKVSDLHRGGRLQGYPLEARVVDSNLLVLTEVQGGRPRTLARVQIEWPEGQEPREASRCVTEPPDPAAWPVLVGAVSTPRYGFALYARRGTEPSDEGGILCAYEWANQSRAPIKYQAQLPIRDRFVEGEGRTPFHQLTLTEGYVSVDGWLFIPADDPAAGFKLLVEGRWDEARELKRQSYLAAQGEMYDSRRGLIISVDTAEMRIRASRPRMLGELLGRYRMSPLARVFRNRPGDVQLEDETITELNGPTLTTYDVSDPHRPRRSGFYHLTSPWTQLFVVDDHALVLQENTVLTVLGLPK